MSLQSQKWFNPSKGEEVLWYSHPSFIMRMPQLFAGVVMAILATAASIYLYFFQDIPIEVIYLLLALIPISLAFSGYKMIVFKNTWYVITNRRIIKKKKIIGRETTSNPHREIVRVDVNVSTFEAIVSKLTGEDIGDMVVRTADDTGERFVITNIPEISLAESYVERLSGTGPDTPAQYDAEERKKMQREQAQMGEDESTDPFNDSDVPQATENSPAESQPGESRSDTSTGRPDPVDDDMDDFDQFEPSDSA
jgi:hypothetical protein